MSEEPTDWKIHFTLSEKVDCEENIPTIKNFELETSTGKEEQKSITGFHINVKNTTETIARETASKKAQIFTDILSVTSGTASSPRRDGQSKIHSSGRHTVSKMITFMYNIRNNADLNISQSRLNEILENRDTEFSQKMRYVNRATDAIANRNPASAIKELILACDEDPQGSLANTVPKMFRGIRWLLNSNYRENDIKWKPIEALFPKPVKRSGYKAWTTEQVALMLEYTSDLRNKALIHFQASTGARVGIHDHPLLMKHLTMMEWNGDGCYAVLLYADFDETVEERDLRDKQDDVQSGDSYWSFLTPEATDCLDKYFLERKRAGEFFDDNTPIFLKDKQRMSLDSKQLSDTNVTSILFRVINGIPEITRIKKGRRYDIQINHGFRKRMNTILKLESNVNSNVAEKILGHKNGLDGVYLAPTRQQCFKEFVKGITQLTVSDTERIKLENMRLKQEKSENESLREKLDTIQEDLDKVKQWREISQKFEKN